MWHVYAFCGDWLLSTVVPASEVTEVLLRYRPRYRRIFKRRLS